MLRIKFAEGRSTFQPGEKVDVLVQWDESSPPELISLDVSWFTVGKGTEDSHSIAETEIAAESSSGQATWAFTLPRGPLSCDGKNLSIQWRILGEGENNDEDITLPFVLGWQDEPIDLRKFPVEEEKLHP